MKRIGLLFVLQLIGLTVLSQLQIVGTVLESSGKTLPGASVILKNTYVGSSTDAQGRFVLDNLRPGSYELQVSFVGYQDHAVVVDLQEDVELTITLPERAFLTDEVIVQGTRANEKMPVSYTELSKKTIREAYVGEDIPFLLTMVPGLVENSESGFGVGNTAFRIRGTDASRINVTINGIPLNDSESHTVFWVNMPDFTESVDNIQVQRGVGTSSNGAAAFGASINFQTSQSSKEAYARVSSSMGSFNTFRNNLAMGTGLINNRFSLEGRYSRLNADSYVNYGFADHQSLYLSANYHGKNSLLKATVIHGDQRTGITWWGVPADSLEVNPQFNPAGVYYDAEGNEQYHRGATDNYRQTHYQLHYSQQLNHQWSFNTALHLTPGEGYYEQVRDDETLSDYGIGHYFPGYVEVISDVIRQKWMKNYFYGGTANLIFRRDALEMNAGAAWSQYDGDHFGKLIWLENNPGVPKDYEWYFNNGLKTEFSSYVKATYTLYKGLNLFGDLQYRSIEYTMSGIDDDLKDLAQHHDYAFFNPKVGFSYQINSANQVYASYSVAHREPTRADFKEATGDLLATPRAERLDDYELGYRMNHSRFSLGLNAYYMDYTDQLVLTGEKSAVGYDIKTNVAESYRAGIEVIGGVKLPANLAWEGNVTLSRNRILNFTEYATYYDENWDEYFVGRELGSTHISYSPEIIFNSKLDYRPFRNFQVSFLSKYVGEQYFDNSSSPDRMLPDYWVNHLFLNYSVENWVFKQIDFRFQVKNLFNATYVSNAYGGVWYENATLTQGQPESYDEQTWAYYFPQAGIHFMGGITVHF